MNVRQRIIEETAKCLSNARILFPTFINCPSPSISFYSKGRAAGQAIGYRALRFNDYVLGQDDAMLVNTVSHEIAHIVCAYTGLGRGHNPGWKRVHRMLGGTAERCFDSTNLHVPLARVQRKYIYKATCGTEVQLSSARHKRMQLDSKSYVVRATGGKLSANCFTGKVI